MKTWICTACGERYEERNPPCKQCAGEEFALVDEQNSHDIGETADVQWRCTECGRIHPRNSPPCNDCGNMMFEQAEAAPADVDDVVAPTTTSDGPQRITLRAIGTWGFGALAVANLLGAMVYLLLVPTLCMLAAVAVSLPPARRRVADRWGIEFSLPAASLLYLVMTLLGNYWMLAKLLA